MKRLPEHPWSEAELRALHARWMAGEFASTLAKIRGKSSGYLLERFRHYGLPLRPKKNPVMPKRVPAGIAEAMYADYQAGMTLADVDRKYGRCPKCARVLFKTRGWPLRPPIKNAWRQHRADGTFQAMPPKTPEEIDALVQAATRVAVPAALKQEWRKWSIERRGEFIRRLRARLHDPKDRPDLPFSSNVVPFDYSTAAAWDILRAANGNLSSREWVMKMDVISQGVIWEGRLFFWVRSEGYYIEAVPWRPDRPRRALRRVIWESIHGKLPENAVVRQIDGNPNNLDPANLTISDRNQVCRENQFAALTRESRERTAILLNRHHTPQHEHSHTLQELGSRAH